MVVLYLTELRVSVAESRVHRFVWVYLIIWAHFVRKIVVSVFTEAANVSLTKHDLTFHWMQASRRGQSDFTS